MQDAVETDPELAIGTAKELIEGVCKTILSERSVTYNATDGLTKILKLTVTELELTRDDIPDQAKSSDKIKNILSSFGTIVHGMAELRNTYGTGHGKPANTKGLSSRHARLAAGAASTLVAFLVETDAARKARRLT